CCGPLCCWRWLLIRLSLVCSCRLCLGTVCIVLLLRRCGFLLGRLSSGTDGFCACCTCRCIGLRFGLHGVAGLAIGRASSRRIGGRLGRRCCCSIRLGAVCCRCDRLPASRFRLFVGRRDSLFTFGSSRRNRCCGLICALGLRA